MGTRQQPARKRRRPTPGDARRGRLWQTGKSGGADPALRPAPALPSGNSPFSFRPAVAFRRRSGPFKNGTAAASLPARHLAEPPTDGRSGGRPSRDGRRRATRLKINSERERPPPPSPLERRMSCRIRSERRCQNALLRFKPVFASF